MENNFVLKVEDILDIKGRGTLLIGRYKGSVRVGDELITKTESKIRGDDGARILTTSNFYKI